MSIGIVGRWPGSEIDGERLVRRADRAMYLVKNAGGGSWRVWHGEDGDDEF
jgi:GGDEF domain-containing protein